MRGPYGWQLFELSEEFRLSRADLGAEPGFECGDLLGRRFPTRRDALLALWSRQGELLK